MIIGVNLYVARTYPTPVISAWGKSDIGYLARTVGIRDITIAWNFTMLGINASQVIASQPPTPDSAMITVLTQIAESCGLSVSHLVLFKARGAGARKRSVSPSNPQDWFASLFLGEWPYMKVAQKFGVRKFAIETELQNLEENPLWSNFFTSARAFYSGILSYATWGAGFFSGDKHLFPGAELYGATAYSAVALPGSETVSALTTAWSRFLNAYVPSNILRRTALDEAGILAQSDAYTDPWGLGIPAGPDA